MYHSNKGLIVNERKVRWKKNCFPLPVTLHLIELQYVSDIRSSVVHNYWLDWGWKW